MNESLQQAYDFLDESNAVYDLLSSLSSEQKIIPDSKSVGDIVFDNDENSFFEIKIVVDELTKDVSLVITDFSEEDEIDEAKMLWESQISDLKQVLGSS